MLYSRNTRLLSIAYFLHKNSKKSLNPSGYGVSVVTSHQLCSTNRAETLQGESLMKPNVSNANFTRIDLISGAYSSFSFLT
jgi:hypothetical protein